MNGIPHFLLPFPSIGFYGLSWLRNSNNLGLSTKPNTTVSNTIGPGFHYRVTMLADNVQDGAFTAALEFVNTVLRGEGGNTASSGYGIGVSQTTDVVNAVDNRNQRQPQSKYQSRSPGIHLSGEDQKIFGAIIPLLSSLGSKCLDACLVNVEALVKALADATTYLRANSTSTELIILCTSLVDHMDKAGRTKNMFISIYFLGSLQEKLALGLPNYKQEQPPLGLVILEELVVKFIGGSAFKENLTSYRSALTCVANAINLLKPFDPSHAIFPGEMRLNTLL